MNDWTIDVSPTNALQIGTVYTIQLEVQLDSYPSIVYTSAKTFDVVLVHPECPTTVVDFDESVDIGAIVVP